MEANFRYIIETEKIKYFKNEGVSSNVIDKSLKLFKNLYKINNKFKVYPCWADRNDKHSAIQIELDSDGSYIEYTVFEDKTHMLFMEGDDVLVDQKIGEIE